MNKNQPIGIFDSGVGGLTVLKEIHRTLPSEDILYLGDTAHVPYGTKSPQTVLQYTLRNALFLLERKVKAVVIACNTASAYGLGLLKEHFKVPIFGVIDPGVRRALGRTKNKRIGIIGTEGTIRSGAYQQALKKIDPEITATAVACSLLVGLAEEGWTEGEVVDRVLNIYLEEFKKSPEKIDVLILGCTHFPLFKKAIRGVLGEEVALVDSAVETANTLSAMLKEQALLKDSDKKGKISLFSTDAPDRLKRIGHLFMGEEVQSVSKVDISSY